MTDVELLESHRGGSEAAFADLVSRRPWAQGNRLWATHGAQPPP